MSEAKPTSHDYYQMRFWLWAAIMDGKSCLAAYDAWRAPTRNHVSGESADLHEFMQHVQHEEFVYHKLKLASYHFATSVGAMMRVLNLAQKLFPEIRTAYDSATHLRAEAEGLRNMLEYAEDYAMTGGMGDHSEQLKRENTSPSAAPVGREAISDPTSFHRDDRGLWLGARLNVQWALAEAFEIRAVAVTIVPPLDQIFGPHPDALNI